MAARKNPRNPKQSNDLARATQLLNRLTSFVNGKIEMTAAQVQAAKVVIGKEIPDKKAIEHSTDPNKPMRGVLMWGDPH